MIAVIRYVIVFFVLNWSVVSYASCYYKNNTTAATYTVTVPTINAQRDVPAGTVLWDSGYLNAPNQSDIFCNGVHPIYRGYDDSSLTLVNGVEEYVYQTNNPGVGIKIWWLSMLDGKSYSPSDARIFYSPAKAEGSKTCKGCEYTNISAAFEVRLISTGQPITDTPLQLSRFSASRIYESAAQLHINFTDADVVVNSASCVLNSKNISVNLGRYFKTVSLNNPGDTGDAVDFKIDLTCDQDTNVNVLFSGTTAAGDSTILTLNDLDSPTSAQGVGVQILYNDRLVNFGELLSTIKNGAEGSVALPFKAHVIRLNENLRAGEINATATFDMIYR
ncbi:fimbrial protein [Citrobacter portucalensis]|uniref:fimbrial protein n=1 Tax=Citrobacter portucalensis TaxID=1639133 RepID=UPI00202CAED8|nr:fimbrial protein [Citrobacter portucalensis]URR11886.1 fimbrial protein [Citrobacter portucalensis]